MENIIFAIIVAVPALLIAVILHEIAHGYVAYLLGDPTAKSLGRLSLNPIRHIDPWMTIILPGLLIFAGSPVIFGGAKPVPVNPRYFQNPRRGMVWVALAGPLTNFILATICGALFHIVLSIGIPGWEWLFAKLFLSAFLTQCFLINLVLGVFNLFPVPPLDGGRIAVGLLPRSLALPLARLEPYGLLIIFALLYTGVINSVMNPILQGAIKLFQ